MEIVIMVAVLTILVGLIFIRKLSKIIIFLSCVITLIIGFMLIVFLVPDSPITLWFTETSAKLIHMDGADKYFDGEIIHSYEVDLATGQSSASDSIPFADSLSSLATDRIAQEPDNSWTLNFNDSYLDVTCDQEKLYFKIIKGPSIIQENT